MKVKINIVSLVCGEEHTYRTHGEFELTQGGFAVRYRFDGDDCVLEAEGEKIVQRRSGGLTFVMQFVPGSSTECVLSEGGNKFVFPVYTEVSGVSVTDEGCTVSLQYLQGEERERTSVLFIAERWRERDGRRTPHAR